MYYKNLPLKYDKNRLNSGCEGTQKQDMTGAITLEQQCISCKPKISANFDPEEHSTVHDTLEWLVSTSYREQDCTVTQPKENTKPLAAMQNWVGRSEGSIK